MNKFFLFCNNFYQENGSGYTYASKELIDKVINYAKEKKIEALEVSDFEALSGSGVAGKIEGNYDR